MDGKASVIYRGSRGNEWAEQRLGELGGGVDRIITPRQRWTVHSCGSVTSWAVDEGEHVVCSLSFLSISKGLIKITLFDFCMTFIRLHAKQGCKYTKRTLLSVWTNRLYSSARKTLAEHTLCSSVYILSMKPTQEIKQV